MQDIEELGFCLIEEMDPDGYEEPTYEPGLEEDVLFQIDDGMVTILSVWACDGSDRLGLTCCENDTGCLDYILEGCLSHKRNGYYIAEACTTHYHQYGTYDGVETDVDFDCGHIRPARIYEIGEVEDWPTTMKQLPNQLWLHLLQLWGDPI